MPSLVCKIRIENDVVPCYCGVLSSCHLYVLIVYPSHEICPCFPDYRGLLSFRMPLNFCSILKFLSEGTNYLFSESWIYIYRFTTSYIAQDIPGDQKKIDGKPNTSIWSVIFTAINIFWPLSLSSVEGSFCVLEMLMI